MSQSSVNAGLPAARTACRSAARGRAHRPAGKYTRVTLCHASPHLSLSLSRVRCPRRLPCSLAHLPICPPARHFSPCPSAVEDFVFSTIIIRVPGRSPVFSKLPRPFSWSPFTRKLRRLHFFLSLHISHIVTLNSVFVVLGVSVWCPVSHAFGHFGSELAYGGFYLWVAFPAGRC